MLKEANRTLAFFCPHCRNASIINRSAFQLAASSTVLECPCGESKVEIELAEGKIRLKVPCLLCDQVHSFTCSTQAFLHEKVMAFSCGASSLDCCYVGEEAAVYAAMERLQETLDELETKAVTQGAFLSRGVMEEVLEELRDIGHRGDISCSCGSKAFSINIQFSAVEIQCNACGGGLKIPAATLTDIEDLCCKSALIIQGKRTKR